MREAAAATEAYAAAQHMKPIRQCCSHSHPCARTHPKCSLQLAYPCPTHTSQRVTHSTRPEHNTKYRAVNVQQSGQSRIGWGCSTGSAAFADAAAGTAGRTRTHTRAVQLCWLAAAENEWVVNTHNSSQVGQGLRVRQLHSYYKCCTRVGSNPVYRRQRRRAHASMLL
jgi:hypothetical protein